MVRIRIRHRAGPTRGARSIPCTPSRLSRNWWGSCALAGMWISADDPKWIEPFSGLTASQFTRLVALVPRRGGDVQRGRPWRLPLENRVLLVATYWRTNLTLRQVELHDPFRHVITGRLAGTFEQGDAVSIQQPPHEGVSACCRISTDSVTAMPINKANRGVPDEATPDNQYQHTTESQPKARRPATSHSGWTPAANRASSTGLGPHRYSPGRCCRGCRAHLHCDQHVRGRPCRPRPTRTVSAEQ